MTRVLFAAKHSWTTLRMSRPLFVDSYLQVTWWTFGQWKEGKICIEWLQSLFFVNSSVGRGTPGMRLYTTVILEALFMFYLLRNYLCFLFFSPQSFFFTGSVVLSYAAAFIVSVCVEFPMMQLEKLIFKTQRWALMSLRSLFCFRPRMFSDRKL